MGARDGQVNSFGADFGGSNGCHFGELEEVNGWRGQRR